MLALSVFAYYSKSVMIGSEADNAHVWQIAINKFLVFAMVSFVAAAQDSACMPKTDDERIVVGGLGMLVRMLERPIRWFEDLGFFSISRQTNFDSVLAYVAL